MLTRSRSILGMTFVWIAGCGGGGGGDDGVVTPDGRPDGMPDAPPVAEHVVVGVDALEGVDYAVVFQDGNGAWQRATEVSTNTYGFDVFSGRYGVGVTCADEFFQEADFIYSTVEEQPAVDFIVFCGYDSQIPLDLYRVSGTVSGLAGNGYTARLGFRTLNDTSSASSRPYQTFVVEGINSFAFARYADAQHEHVDSIFVDHGVSVVGPMTRNVNFTTQGQALAPLPVTVTGTGTGDQVLTMGRFRPRAAGYLTVTRDLTPPLTADIPPSAVWQNGDAYFLSAYASKAVDEYRLAAVVYPNRTAVPAAAGFEIPGELGGFTFATATGGGFTSRWTPRPETDTYYVELFSDGFDDPGCEGFCLPAWLIQMTPGWAGTGTEVAFSTADRAQLEALGAWDPRLDMRPGTPVYWDVEAEKISDDGTRYAAGHSGDVTP